MVICYGSHQKLIRIFLPITWCHYSVSQNRGGTHDFLGILMQQAKPLCHTNMGTKMSSHMKL